MTKDGMQHGDQGTALGKQYLLPSLSGLSETCVHMICIAYTSYVLISQLIITGQPAKASVFSERYSMNL